MKLIIPQDIEERIHAYVMSVNSEIAGMGKLEEVDANTVRLVDIAIYDQEVTATTADLSDTAIAKWMGELLAKGESPKAWRLWWHSHHTMEAFFSGTDTATMDRQTEGDYMVSLVVNQRRERKARLDMYRPFRLMLSTIDIEVEGANAFTVPQAIRDEVALKVKAKAYTPYKRPYGFHEKETYDTPKTVLKNGKRWEEWDETDYSDSATYAVDSAVPEYSGEEVRDIIKLMESQRESLRNLRGEDTEEYRECTRELSEWYYTLAEAEADDVMAVKARNRASFLEDEVYTQGL